MKSNLPDEHRITLTEACLRASRLQKPHTYDRMRGLLLAGHLGSLSEGPRRLWVDAAALERYLESLPSASYSVAQAPPADDLDGAHKRIAQLATAYHRAGVALAQSDEMSAQAVAQRADCLLALEALALTSDDQLQQEIAVALSVWPTVTYTREPSGAWTLASPAVDATCTSPVPA